MKLKIEIHSWYTGSVLFEYESENNTIKETLKKAVETGANLRGANLRGADLTGANLMDADLMGADLMGANLRGANLRGANLMDADLMVADLMGANLRGANLRGANLTDANLTDANLEPIKQDFFMVLLHGIKEIEFLKKAVIAGEIDGSTYEKPEGGCSCLSGTLKTAAIVQDGPQEAQRISAILSCRRAERPAERFFLGIKPRDTPENNQASKLVLEWIEEFQRLIA